MTNFNNNLEHQYKDPRYLRDYRNATSQRNSPMWDKYQELYKIFVQSGMPDDYDFKKICVKLGYPKEWPYQNAAKWCRRDWEEFGQMMLTTPQVHPGAKMFSDQLDIQRKVEAIQKQRQCDEDDDGYYTVTNYATRKRRKDNEDINAANYYSWTPLY